MSEPTTLGDEFPKEQARVRELLADYKSIGQSGIFAATIIEGVLAQADRAAISGDLVEMLKAYKRLKECA